MKWTLLTLLAGVATYALVFEANKIGLTLRPVLFWGGLFVMSLGFCLPRG